MAHLSIRGYTHLAAISGGILPVGQEPAVETQIIEIGGSSADSAVLNIATRFIRVHAGAKCSIDIGAAPDAVDGKCDMIEGQTEYFGVVGGTHKVAVISRT